MRVRPARDVARGIDSRRAGLLDAVDDNASVDGMPGLLRKRQPRPDADAGHDEIGWDHRTAFEHDAALIDGAHAFLKVEDHAMLFVKAAHELPHLGTEHPLS